MLLRMSTLLLKTLREEPADAEVPSHRLLLRAGFIRRAAPGGHTWLPLGKLVLDRVTAVVREEMIAVGGQEVSFPALLPREPYDVSNRWTEYGDDIFTLHDRRGGEYLLAPTHEEMFTLLVQDLTSSYRDFPRLLFQVQTKYRDEARPRAGLLRGREFLMKDAYSFTLTDTELESMYDAVRAAYERIFDRIGLSYTIVAAVSGAMGGSASEEFLATSEVGEDTFVGCTNCAYAANTEAVVTPVPPVDVPAATWPSTSTAVAPTVPYLRSASKPPVSSNSSSCRRRSGISNHLFSTCSRPCSRANSSAPFPDRKTWGPSSSSNRARLTGARVVRKPATAPARRSAPSMIAASSST